jgi:broad specificity phosphatase PhoE
VADQLQSLQLGNIVTSPLLRCQQTSEPLAQMWKVVPQVCAEVSEIPSPNGVAMSDRIVWLRQAMQGTWSDLGSDYVAYRDCITEFVRDIQNDTVIFSHFIAINAVIGGVLGDDRLVIRSLDNCSVTIFERDTNGKLSLVQGGHEADTLIR